MIKNFDKQSLYYLFGLRVAKGIGEISAAKLLAHFKSPQAIFEATKAELKECGVRKNSIDSIKSMDFDQFDEVFEWLEATGHNIIPLGSTYYPPLLNQTATPPLFLFTMGKIEYLLIPQIAIVGSRNPTPQGIKNTRLFCQSLVDMGLTITSGLALGIDGEAHRATLASGGYTIAVTGTGLSRVYPAYHRKLAHSIIENGVLVSECFPNEGVSQGNFPRRNRIIAGLSLGTLVIEAAQKSGSLITARLALEESREVFAVPGSITNPVAQGCHALIRQGATLVENAEQLLEELPSLSRSPRHSVNIDKRPELNEETVKFLNCIDFETTSIDSIATRSELSVESVLNKLLLLELDGWVVNNVGGYSRT
ncbi:MAG: DNA-processing protein DprA [Kangiellaceae bacterium]|nr:DNA-processing protein DprA [Kangiellaceae bacterium]